MDYSGERDLVVEWMVKNLVGPAGGSDEEIGERPSGRYLCGILYPISDVVDRDESGAGLELEDESDLSSPVGEDEASEKDQVQVVQRKYYTPPSAAGMSFFAGHDIEIEVSVSAGRYRRTTSSDNDDEKRHGPGRTSWRRISLPEDGGESTFLLRPPPNPAEPVKRIGIWEDRARLYSIWRPYEGGFLVTLSLSNVQKEDGPFPVGWEEACLFQVSLECRPRKGKIFSYPEVEDALIEDEERELKIQYRDHGVFGVGHGAAVDWAPDERFGASYLKMSFLPGFEVPIVTPVVSGIDEEILKLDHLARIESRPDEICDHLEKFIDTYSDWIDAREKEIHLETFGKKDRRAAERIVERCRYACRRMARGVKRLRSDDKAAGAFALANLAMARQMKRDRLKDPVWRPFQLGFFLLCLESLVDEGCPERDWVDLLWFPTGGGKTEAYLSLIAFLICYRRLRYPEKGGGMAVLMRYTLRLLTTQQFERAARLICVLELLRRERPRYLGLEPITLGLWVGGSTVPNTFVQAARELNALAKEGPVSAPGFILDKCPNPGCGTELRLPAENNDGPAGLSWGRRHFHFQCPNPECDLNTTGDGVIPVNVVDEHLYRFPPTLLLGTVDKFALFAWKSEPNAFLGRKGNRPPELIVQDELHLISGELGTIYGVYEAGLDTVINLKGVWPKYIASTATIRHATRQVGRLYGRETAVFPPPGLSCGDSFFAQTVPVTEKPGRLYLGYLAPARKRRHALAPMAAALLTSPSTRSHDPDLRDAWWTLLIYHGSLKGVGTSMNTMRGDVPDLMNVLYTELEKSVVSEDPETDAFERRDITGEQVSQLTSNISAAEIRRNLSRMEWTCEHPQSISALLCTNMISVGVDVDRLALMIVSGQPLTTGEYIQASSRVGRGDIPGIVVANYFRNQARSLSHYENFRAYHESFYRFVEPTSVTPYSTQARKRALHAALIVTIRHGVPGMLGQKNAGDFDPDNPMIRRAIQMLTQRCRTADPDQGDKTGENIEALIAHWKSRVLESRRSNQNLTYSDRDRANLRLLQKFNERGEENTWPTLVSMRHVDDDCGLKIVPPTGFRKRKND